MISIYPNVGDTSGGGGAVIITVDSSDFASGATLGGVALDSFVILDPTHVSGVPGPYPNHAIVDVIVTYDPPAGNPPKPDTVGALLFEYWTPGSITNLDVYLDAAKGVTADAVTNAVSSWKDEGPNAREFVQADVLNQPTKQDAVFGPMPSIRFQPTVDAAGTHFTFVRMTGNVSHPEGRSIFAVAKWTAAGGAPGNLGNVPLCIVGDAGSGYGSFGANAGAIESNHNNGGVVVPRGAGLNDDQARLIGVTNEVIDQLTHTSVETKMFVGNNQQGLDHFAGQLVGPNTYDAIGAGAPNGTENGWEGDLGAVIIASGPISVEDRTKLDLWAQQRFGTPRSAPLDAWSRVLVTVMPKAPAEWFSRDGEQMVQLASGRILMIGGWSAYKPWNLFAGGVETCSDLDSMTAEERNAKCSTVTNEVWKSDDRGETWSLLLPHDAQPKVCGPDARFAPGHTVGVTTYKGRAVVIGSDPYTPVLTGDVWHSSKDGSAWTRIATDAPSAGICLFMVGNIGDDIFLIGGQVNSYHEDTGVSDAWRSSDGGLTWTKIASPPWALPLPGTPRGMVYRPIEHNGKLFIVGGGRYDETTPVMFNGVYSFDGINWETVLADGHGGPPVQFKSAYYVALAALDGRLWLFNGVDSVTDFNRAMYSENGGKTWEELPGGAGGQPSHADAVLALDDRVLRVPGLGVPSMDQRLVFKFVHN